ncbi:MAG: SulP family inorganic anion transporter [Arcobacteraceae bacterium]|nr:SulP family inorganic anion transporter [Arcobacteraceae bacterium]
MIDLKSEFFNSNIKNDILSSLVIAVVLIPEAIVFSVIAGFSPIIGLYTAFILGIITALIGGKSGVISGLTGAIAVVLFALSVKIQQTLPADMLERLKPEGELSILILQYILLATILAGIFQVLLGVFKVAKYIRLVPNYVLFGLVNGLAIITFVAQFYTFKSEGFIYYILVIATILIVYYFPKLTKIIPSTLIALLVLTFVVIYFDLDTKRIGDLSNISSTFPSFSIPKIYINAQAILTVLPYALLIAFISSLESLLTLSLLDEMTEKQGNANQECIALGAGNITCGFFGATAGSSMLGQSVLNFSNNASGRTTTFLVPVLLMLFILYFSGYIAIIPVAILVGILATIPMFLFQWQNQFQIKKLSNLEKFLIVLVTIITIFANLEIAFALSLLIAFVLYIFKLFSIKSRVYMNENKKVYELYGPLYFNSTQSFLEIFDIQNDPKNVVIDFKNTRVVDQAAINAIEHLVERYKQEHKTLRIKHLSAHCKKALTHAAYYCEYNEDDPNYKVALDK